MGGLRFVHGSDQGDGRTQPAKTAMRNQRERSTITSVTLVCCALFLSASVGGCQRDKSDELIDTSIDHLKAASRLMEEAGGDHVKLAVAVMHYRLEHRDEFNTLRKTADQLVKAMTVEERKRFNDKARVRTLSAMDVLKTAAGKFEHPKKALNHVAPLILRLSTDVQISKRRTARPWMPPVPELPGQQHVHGPTATTRTH